MDIFNNVVVVNNWDAKPRLLWLKVWITGRAQMAIKKLPDNARESFESKDLW